MDIKIKPNDENCFYENTIDGTEIDNVVNFKDLGVHFDSSLSFKTHISQIVTAAKQRTFLIFRCFITKDVKSLLQGYKSYILPILNYCSPVWSPCAVGDVMLLESVQRAFTKKLPGFETKPYFERIGTLYLPTLELRRLYSDLVLCYKILHGLAGGRPENYGLILAHRQSRGHRYKLSKTNTRVDVRKFYFGCRICDPWNSLPDSVVSTDTVQLFKKMLTKCCFNKYLVFTE